MGRGFVSSVVAAVLLAGFAQGAKAETLNLPYSLNLPGGQPIDNLFIYAEGAGQDQVFVSPLTITSGTGSLTQVVDFDVSKVIVVGTNVSDTNHIIMFTGEGFAAASAGYKWSEVFPAPSPRHSVFFSTLIDAHSGNATALSALGDFLRSDAADAAEFDPDGRYAIVEFTVTVPIGTPEPASLGVLALGGVALLGRRRK